MKSDIAKRVVTELHEQPCCAIVSEPPHYVNQHWCPNRATKKVGKYHVCGTHARVAKRWQEYGRLDEMVSFYWTSK